MMILHVHMPACICALIAFLTLCVPLLAADAGSRQTENVILIAIDGVRWHEAFKGADEKLIGEKALVHDIDRTRRLFRRDSVEGRRQALVPFLWSTVAVKGQLFGDRSRNCIAAVENKAHASEECYSEILRGFDDPTKYGPHPDNPTNVLEWLNRREAFKGRVSVHTVWEPILRIAEVKRANLHGFGGWQQLAEPLSEQDRHVNQIAGQLPAHLAGSDVRLCCDARGHAAPEAIASPRHVHCPQRIG